MDNGGQQLGAQLFHPASTTVEISNTAAKGYNVEIEVMTIIDNA